MCGHGSEAKGGGYQIHELEVEWDFGNVDEILNMTLKGNI